MGFHEIVLLLTHWLPRLIVLSLAYVCLRGIWHATYNLFLSPLRKFPGPKAAALTELWEIYHVIKCDRFNVIQDLHEKYGPVVRIAPNQVSIASPQAFQQVFVTKCSQFIKSDFYSTIQPGVGPHYAGLFNYTDHQRAVEERRDLQPLFSPAKLKQYELRYDTQVQKLISIMNERKELDMFKYFKYLLLDAIGDLAFDQSFDQLEAGEDHQYVIDFNNAFMLIGLQNTFAFLIPWIPYLPFRALKDAYFGLQRVFAYSQACVKKYLSRDVSDKQSTLMSGFLDSKTGEPKKGYTPWSIALAGHGFIIAGSEASSITLTYMLWVLIKNPDIERKLRSELSSLPASYGSTDLATLPYLDALMRETLRVYPPAPSPMPRMVPETGFKTDGMSIPPHTIISAQPYTIHRSREVFDDPEKFDPERWIRASPAEKENMNKAFVPFSAGQRGCIGRGMAWMHMMNALAAVVQAFERFELREDMTDDDMVLIERGALAKPKSTKLWIRCYPRTS